MPLPIRDGNQSLTTLSTILVSNSHIPAHTVVSFGAQGITDIATAVSGVELGPNTLNALENITVTLGQVTITGGLTDAQLRASAVTIGGSVTATISGTPSVTFGTAVITGSTSVLNFPATQPVSIASVTIGNSVTIGSLPNISGTVTVSNLPATQAVTFGQPTITGSVSILNIPATQTVTFSQASVTFGTAVITGSTSILNFPATQTVTFGTINGTVTIGNSVTIGSLPAISGTVTASVRTDVDANSGLPCVAVAFDSIGGVQRVGANNGFPIKPMQDGAGNSIPLAISGTVTIGSALPAGTNQIGVVTIGAGTVTLGASTAQIGSVTASISGTVPVSISSVTVGNSVTVSSLPAISGTVTVGNSTTASAVAVRLIAEDTNPGGTGAGVNVNLYSNDNALLVDALKNGNSVLGYDGLSSYVQVKQAVGSSVTISSLPAISGTVTANNSVLSNVLEYDGNNFFLRIGGRTASGRTDYPIAISGSVTASISNSVTIASLPAISGTVTANSSNGSLTTRFGSVVTANTAFETSAVTNANRKYLLIQNVTTASNVITVGIGFTPTTTQGIQLFAGAGLTFEGSYIPTGAVNLLSSVTASCFTILEA